MTKLMTVLAALSLSLTAHAGCFSDDGYGSDCHISPVGAGVLIVAAAFTACSPEVKEGNLAATERTLGELAKSPKFASAVKFQKLVSAIAKDKRGDAKIIRYFDLVDVDASNQKQVLEFMGQREVRGSQLNALEKKADLTPEQSEVVVQALNQSLRGSLQ